MTDYSNQREGVVGLQEKDSIINSCLNGYVAIPVLLASKRRKSICLREAVK